MSELCLYRIRHRKSGLYFSANSNCTETREGSVSNRIAQNAPMVGDWGPHGVCFRQIKTIKKHLVQLCSRYEMRFRGGTIFYDRVRVRDYDPAELELYEVETIRVAVNQTTITPAAELLPVVESA